MTTNPGEAQAPLTPSEHPNWNESQFVWWYDPVAGIAGFHRVAHQPNRNNAHVWSCIVTGGGRCFRRCDSAFPYNPSFRVDGAYRTEGLELRHHGRGGVEVRSDYPSCTVRLSLEDHFPAVDLSHHGDHYNQGAELREAHFEAAGAVTGAAELDGKTYKVNCLGYRDHSWGPRDLHKIQASMWATGTSGSTAFLFGKSVIRGSAPFVGGYVWRDGDLQPVTDVDAVVGIEFDGVTYRDATAKVTTANGTVHEIEFSQTIGGVVVDLDTWIGFEAACAITVDGEVGIGNFERAINPCGGSLLPEYAVHGVVSEGLSDSRSPGKDEVIVREWNVAGSKA